MFAIGEMDMDPEKFWSLTWGDYIRKVYGLSQKEKNEWRRIRWLATVIRRSLGGKETAEQLLPLDYKDSEIKHEEADYVKANMQKIKNIYNVKS